MTIQDDPPSLNVEWDGPVNRSDKEYLRWRNASIEDWAEKWYGANRHQSR